MLSHVKSRLDRKERESIRIFSSWFLIFCVGSILLLQLSEIAEFLKYIFIFFFLSIHLLPILYHSLYLDKHFVANTATMDIETLVFGSDAKKIWFAHRMLVEDKLCATVEFMALHYNTRKSRTMEMPAEVQAQLGATAVAELPDWAGRQISLVKK